VVHELRCRAAGALDPCVLLKVGQVDRRTCGEPMIAWERREHRVVEQVATGDGWVGWERGEVVVVDEREISVTTADVPEGCFGIECMDVELDGGEAKAKGAQGGGHEGRERRRESGEADRAGAEAGEVVQRGLGGGEAGEDVDGVGDEHAAGFGEAHAAAAAMDEREPGLAFELGDLLGHCGLGEGERVGGAGERAVAGDLAQHEEATDVEHQPDVRASLADPRGGWSRNAARWGP